MASDTQSIIDALADCILLVETDGTVTCANAAAGQALRADPATLTGRNLYDLIDDPDRRAPVYLRRCAASLQPLPGTLAVRGADASVAELRCEGARLRPADGSFDPAASPPILLRCRPKREAVSQFTILNEKIAGLTREIVARRAAEDALRESEAQFRMLVDSIPTLAWMARADGWIAWYNQRWYEYTGATPEEMQGWGWQSAHDPETLPAVLEGWRHSIATGEPFEMVFPLRRADGVFHPFLTRVVPVRSDDGRVTRWFGTNTDITDQREAEETLRRLNEVLENRVAAEVGKRMAAEEALRQSQKMEAIGQLTGGIAHDFNNILHVILGNLDALRRLAATDPERFAKEGFDRFVASAVRGAERAATLTQRLLAFGRRQALNPAPIDVNRLVASLSDLLRRLLGETIGVETVLGGGLWRTVADANQLENALLNLAVNARDAMPAGGKLTIETANTHLDEAYAAAHREVEAGQYVMVAVSDTGAGMTRAVMEKAFEPFFTTKAIGQGTGLGLSQVYGFVKQSGGHLKLYSEPGEGTTVKLYLPRLTPEAARRESSGAAGHLPAGTDGRLILLVEDDPDVCTNTVEMLRELGYRVAAAADGPGALRLLDSTPDVNLLLTDVGLPGALDGRQLADEATRRRPGLRVLFTTGYARNAIVHHGRLDPGVELITKPYSLSDLGAKLRQVLSR
ncbi:MAG: PAS domain-containing protein [Alphaproteobacteria bacterium]